MSASYLPVTWNRNKLIYDAVLLLGVVLYVLVYLMVAPSTEGDGVDEWVLRMRAFGSCTFLMLTVLLCIGPLARLDRRWLPLLYNRRHFGVITCAVAAAHASVVLGWYFAFSPTNPFVAVLSSNPTYGRLIGFPFELLGVAALMILVVLAVTSHDFWLSFLTPPVWKAMHMAVYVAYGLIVLHVALGPLQAKQEPTLAILVGASLLAVTGLHLAAAFLGDSPRVRPSQPAAGDAWLAVGPVSDIAENRARIVELAGGERVAIFRYDGRLSAVENACRHQNGPLGEGRIVDGCITCPWHGFQYRPEDGCAPPPFTEKLKTYRVRITDGVVFLDPLARPRGSFVEPARLDAKEPAR